ncbi:MAG TPA: hypothetical protein VEQ42_08420 [Pyrinomonadaceae bacterium]|nr:hypothetical protein [Pyrinomonadaceae bacterium]
MKRRGWGLLLLAALCALLSYACGGGGRGGARPGEAAAELDAFTEELVRKVESAAEGSAGLADARALLDARRGELRSKVVAVRKSEEYARDGAARERWEERESENVFRVAGLRTKYVAKSMGDAAFKSQLDALVADYQKLFEP